MFSLARRWIGKLIYSLKMISSLTRHLSLLALTKSFNLSLVPIFRKGGKLNNFTT